MNDLNKGNVQLVPHIVSQRFFTVPRLETPVDKPQLEAHPLIDEGEPQAKGDDSMRYAGYVRISSEEQVGNFSVDAQRRAIEEWVNSQGGKLAKLYIDEAQSGRTADRPEFQRMRRDAKSRKFDALVVHKFDRFARNRTDALAIKSLLRQDYSIKVFSVSEPSEDSDGALGALIEGIMESVADWYSRNLASETAKGKHERATQGYHNNGAPFGLDKTDAGVLVPNNQELSGLHLAFDLYATGEYSDNAIAHILNEKGYRSKSGKSFSTDTVRDMLQNRTYLGYVKYQEYRRHADGRRSWAAPVQWFKGKHEPVIPQELFDKCQRIRAAKAVHHEYYPKYRVYLLRDLIYCADCVAGMPPGTEDESYGKMRPLSTYEHQYLYYRCRARDFGRTCPQKTVRADVVEEQVVEALKTLKPPADWRARMVTAMGQLLGDQRLDERIEEIRGVIDRMDFRWDQGFITDRTAYLEQRVKLQQELEQLTPIADDELEVAADLLENFSTHWETTGGDRGEQRRLIALIVGRVWVKGDRVVAMSLRPNYHVTLGLESKVPTEITVGTGDDILSRRERRDSNPRSRP